jgi:putative hydrolase of the HAD superfamily
MTTVLVHSTYVDHPIQLNIREWTEPPEHIHHMTTDLVGFLGPLGQAVAQELAASNGAPHTG